MKANKYQQEILNEMTGLLLPHNHISKAYALPSHVLARMAMLNDYLRPDGLQLKLTHYSDGIGCGWIIQFEAL